MNVVTLAIVTDTLVALIEREQLNVITSSASLKANANAGPSAIIASEGGDFLEGQLDRVDGAYTQHQLRHLQLVHYRSERARRYPYISITGGLSMSRMPRLREKSRGKCWKTILSGRTHDLCQRPNCRNGNFGWFKAVVDQWLVRVCCVSRTRRTRL
jgi:hypothetical protein